MAIELNRPPPELTEHARSAVLERARKRQFVTPGLARAATDSLALAAPHPVFSLSLDDVAEGRGLAAAVQVGWRYLIREGDRTIAAAELPLDAADADAGFHLNEGPFAGGTDEAIRQLEGSQPVAERDYELRLLKIMALYTVAVWLHRDGDDVLVPIAQCDPAVDSGTLYSADELLERLRPSADARRSVDTSPREQ